MAIVSPPEGSRPAEAPLNPENLADEASKRVERIAETVPAGPRNYHKWTPHEYNASAHWYENNRSVELEEMQAVETESMDYARRHFIRNAGSKATRAIEGRATLEAHYHLSERHCFDALATIAEAITPAGESVEEYIEDLADVFADFCNGHPADGLLKFYGEYLKSCAKNDAGKKAELETFLASNCPGHDRQILAMLKSDPAVGESIYRMSFHNSQWYFSRDQEFNEIGSANWEAERDQQRITDIRDLELSGRDDWVAERVAELARENPGTPEGELQLRAQAEFHRQNSQFDYDIILGNLRSAFSVDPNLPSDQRDQRVQEINAKLNRVFSRYAGPNDPTGFYTFFNRYREALYQTNDAETVQRMQNELRAEFPREYPFILQALRSSAVQDAVFRMNTNDQLARAAEIDLETLRAGGTPGLYNRASAALLSEEGTPTERLENFRAIMREAAHGDQQLQALVEVSTSIEQTNRIIRTLQLQERREGRTRSTRRTERAETVQRIVSSPILSAIGSMRMPERAREAITAVAENPRAREIVSLMLRNGFTATDTHLQGSIAGADVMLHYGNPNEAPRFWIMGNQNNYTFDPSPEGYDTTRMQAMAAEGGSFAVREDESLANVIGLFLAREDLHDERTMNQFTANKLENFMRLLCGRNADAREERDRLTALGIYRGGSNVSPMQIQRFAIALPHYFGEAGETNIDEEGALGFEAMVTLAQIWEDEGFRLPPANDLIRRTQERTNS